MCLAHCAAAIAAAAAAIAAAIAAAAPCGCPLRLPLPTLLPQKVQLSMKATPVDPQGNALAVAASSAVTQVAALSSTANDVISRAAWTINSVDNAPLMFSAILGLAKAIPPTVRGEGGASKQAGGSSSVAVFFFLKVHIHFPR
jgi:hypothetical protein